MIIYFSSILALHTIDWILTLQIPLMWEIEGGVSPKEVIRQVIVSAIWIPYFLKSKRVKNTFVR